VCKVDQALSDFALYSRQADLDGAEEARSDVPCSPLAGGQRATPKYVVVWKQEDGAWRRHVDIWNTDTV